MTPAARFAFAQQRAAAVAQRAAFERLGVHEAGHATTARALGVGIERLWAGFDDRGGERGHMMADISELPALEQLVILVAGGVAESRAYGGPTLDAGDRADACEIALAQHPRDVKAAAALIGEAEQIAGRILDRHWGVVSELARTLADRGRMDAGQIEPYLRSVPRVAPLTKSSEPPPVRSRPAESTPGPSDLLTRSYAAGGEIRHRNGAMRLR
jgi:hypothetical protein